MKTNAERCKEWREKPENKLKQKVYWKKYVQTEKYKNLKKIDNLKNKVKRYARERIRLLKRKVNFSNDGNCLKCGVLYSELQAHHISYKNPNIAVFGFCGSCHKSLHITR